MRNTTIIKSITTVDTHSLKSYLRDVDKTNKLTIEEERELARRMEKGDATALNELVVANLRYVISLAKSYQWTTGLLLEDLINEGNIGLINAVRKYDWTKGNKVITLAKSYIQQAIQQAIAEYGRTFRLPQQKAALLSKVKSTSYHFEQEYGRQPSVSELAEILEVSEEDITDVLKASCKCCSLDEPVYEDNDCLLSDTIESDTFAPADIEMLIESDRILARSFLGMLPDRDRKVVEKYYGIGYAEAMSVGLIAMELNLSEMRVRQIINASVEQLRDFLYERQLIA